MSNSELALQLLITLLSQATQISSLLQTAHATGRDLTDAEIDQCVAADDTAKIALQQWINATKGSRP